MNDEKGNKYIEKLTRLQNNLDKINDSIKEKSSGILLGSTGIGLTYGSAGKILGYHKVYHGTDSVSADSIKKHGLDPTRGGTGASHLSGREDFIDSSRGKVHLTKDINTAKRYAKYKTEQLNKYNPGLNAKPTIIKARVSDRMWQGSMHDPDAAYSKFGSSTMTHRIGPKFIAGGEGSKGMGAFMQLKHLKKYYSTEHGRKRGALGISMLLGGLTGIASSVNKLKNKTDTNGK